MSELADRPLRDFCRELLGLQLLLLGLRALGLVEWSWWLVLLPLWGTPLLVLLVATAIVAAVWWSDRPGRL